LGNNGIQVMAAIELNIKLANNWHTIGMWFRCAG
jgi:hypothetical protein